MKLIGRLIHELFSQDIQEDVLTVASLFFSTFSDSFSNSFSIFINISCNNGLFVVSVVNVHCLHSGPFDANHSLQLSSFNGLDSSNTCLSCCPTFGLQLSSRCEGGFIFSIL